MAEDDPENELAAVTADMKHWLAVSLYYNWVWRAGLVMAAVAIVAHLLGNNRLSMAQGVGAALFFTVAAVLEMRSIRRINAIHRRAQAVHARLQRH